MIITQPRSGSYYFQSLLGSAEDIMCHGEIFKNNCVEISPWHRGRLDIDEEDVEQRDFRPFVFVTRLRRLNPKKIFGFKAFWPHLTPHKLVIKKIIHNDEWKKIFLIRNPLQSYASLLRANKTNVWVKNHTSQGSGENQEDFVTVHFDAASFEKHLLEYSSFLAMNDKVMQSQPNCCYELGYREALIQAKQEDVLKFLGSTSSSGQLISKYKKQYSGNLADAFSNGDDLLRYLEQKKLMDFIATDQDVFHGY